MAATNPDTHVLDPRYVLQTDATNQTLLRGQATWYILPDTSASGAPGPIPALQATPPGTVSLTDKRQPRTQVAQEDYRDEATFPRRQDGSTFQRVNAVRIELLARRFAERVLSREEEARLLINEEIVAQGVPFATEAEEAKLATLKAELMEILRRSDENWDEVQEKK